MQSNGMILDSSIYTCIMYRKYHEHDDVIQWKHFPHYWPFVRGIHRSPQRPVTRSFDVFIDLHLNKRLCKQSWGWWFKTPLRSLWRHCNEYVYLSSISTSSCVVLLGSNCHHSRNRTYIKQIWRFKWNSGNSANVCAHTGKELAASCHTVNAMSRVSLLL